MSRSPHYVTILLILCSLCLVLWGNGCGGSPAGNEPAKLSPGAQLLRGVSSSSLSRADPSSSPALPPCYPPNPTTCEDECKQLLDIIQYERAKSSWNSYYGDVSAELYRRGVSEGVFVEVGTAYGGLALAMLQAHPKLRVFTVDPFLGGYDGRDAMSDLFKGFSEKYGADKFPALWARALAFEAGSLYGCRYANYNELSHIGAAHFPPRSIDAIFIDGDHTKEGVVKDITAWRGVLKMGKLMIFNDYQHGHWPGVVEAVNEHAAKTEQALYTLPQKSWGNVALYNLPDLFSSEE